MPIISPAALIASVQSEPFAEQIVLLALSSSCGIIGAITIMAWRSIRADIRKCMMYQHNSMIITFQLLTRLHPQHAHVVNQAMQEYMVQKPEVGSKWRSASAGN